jgi:thymidylate kinase
VGLEDAVRSAIRARGEDNLVRIAARISRSSASRFWKSAYGRSTDRFSALTRFLAANPRLMEIVLASQRERRERDRGQDQVLGWVVNLMARYQLAIESDRSDSLVIDEGFLQRAVALFGHGFGPEDEANLRAYLGAIPRPDVVVLLETPLELCIRRLDARGWSERVAEVSEPDRRGFLEASSRVVNEVSAQVEALGTSLIRVEGTEPIAVSAGSIIGRLRG